jgi:hypothetical protein
MLLYLRPRIQAVHSSQEIRRQTKLATIVPCPSVRGLRAVSLFSVPQGAVCVPCA